MPPHAVARRSALISAVTSSDRDACDAPCRRLAIDTLHASNGLVLWSSSSPLVSRFTWEEGRSFQRAHALSLVVGKVSAVCHPSWPSPGPRGTAGGKGGSL